jgi:hypothetical protein
VGIVGFGPRAGDELAESREIVVSDRRHHVLDECVSRGCG